MKYLAVCLGFVLCMAHPLTAQKSSRVSVKDFELITGSWQGSLTYLDYTSGKPYTMAANINIFPMERGNTFIFSHIYPKEASANSTDTVTLSGKGRYIGKEKVISRKELPGGTISIVTEETGTDGNDNKPATFRHTYTFGRKVLVMRKDVQFAGTTEWIKRHEYSYTR